MIIFDNKEITKINIGQRALSAIYKGSRLIWMAIRSCFGSGLWVQQKPWLDNEKWKNNK